MIKIPDIIQLNDWEPKKFFRIILAIQLAMLGIISLDFVGLEIPILRQVVGFVYLTFVPGIIILRLLKMHKLGIAETIILSTGLSVSLLMFSGLFLNTILPYLNIESPLSFWNVVIFITALVTFLGILSNNTDKFYQYELPHLKITRTSLYLILLPVLSIVGAYFVNFHKNNILLLILIGLLALIPVLVALKKIPSDLYPLAIVVISISLLFHRSLISVYLTGFDIHQEYYYHKLVVDNAYWNPEIPNNVNAMLSIVILPAVYSYFLKMDGAWVFKIIYPVIFSLVPLGLYCIYHREIKSDKIAFYSVFFLMSFITFFTEMLSLARQEIAELFFVLLILLMVQDTMNKNVRNFLALIFGASLVTSHYGLSYIFFILIIIIYLFSTDLIKTLMRRWLVLPEFNFKKKTLIYFTIFYIIFLILWYINVSESSAFKSIIRIGDHVITSIFTELFNSENRDINVLMAIGAADPIVNSFGRQIHRVLQFITQFFIIIGFLKIIINMEYFKLKAEYFYLIVAGMGILILSLLPFTAMTLNMTRIYHIVLLIISPLFIIGGIFVIEKTINLKNKLKQDHVILILILGVLIPYFLFMTGFVYEMTNDSPTSLSLGMERMKDYNITKKSYYNTYTPENDVYSARWFSGKNNADKIIYADGNSELHVLYSYGMIHSDRVRGLYDPGDLKVDKIYPSYYLYMDKFNVCDDHPFLNESIISSSFKNSSRIYSNGCGEIYEK